MKFQKWFVPLVFTLTILLMLWLSVSEQSPFRVQSDADDAGNWETGWEAVQKDGEPRALAFPQRLDDGELSVRNTLPTVLPDAAKLYVKTNYQRVTAVIGGVEMPLRGVATQSGGACGYELPWTTLALTGDMAGQTIELTFSQTGSKPFVEVYSVRLGHGRRHPAFAAVPGAASMVLSLLVLIFALALLVFAVLEARRHKRGLPTGYLFLIAFLTLAGVWFYTDTDISGIRYLGSAAFFYVNYFSYLLMPVPFFLFVCSRQSSFCRMGVMMRALLALNILTQLVLTLTGRALLWVGLTASHVLLAAAALTMPWMLLFHRPRRSVKAELYNSVFIAAFTGLVTLALYYLLPVDDNSSVFRYGILVMVVALTVDLLRANEDIVIEANQIEQLRIREEEYRIAARQSDKHVLRFDVDMRTLLKGEEPSPLFNADRDIPDMPEALVREGGVAEESVADFRAFFDGILSGRPEGTCAVSLRARDGHFAWYRADFTTIFTDDGHPSQTVVSLSNITEQRQKELAYQKWKQTYADMPADGMNYYEYNLTRGMLIGEAGRMIPPLPREARRSLPLLVDHLAGRYVAQEDRQRFRRFSTPTG
jgi:PAS domain-containing protein